MRRYLTDKLRRYLISKNGKCQRVNRDALNEIYNRQRSSIAAERRLDEGQDDAGKAVSN